MWTFTSFEYTKIADFVKHILILNSDDYLTAYCFEMVFRKSCQVQERKLFYCSNTTAKNNFKREAVQNFAARSNYY